MRHIISFKHIKKYPGEKFVPHFSERSFIKTLKSHFGRIKQPHTHQKKPTQTSTPIIKICKHNENAFGPKKYLKQNKIRFPK